LAILISIVARTLCVGSRHGVSNKSRPSHTGMATLNDVQISVKK
jgi:hypothetical protein